MDEENRFLILSLEGESYAISIARLAEISAPRQILKDPNLSGVFEGKVDYRGKMTPVLNLRKVLHMPSFSGSALLFIKSAKGVLGILVDSVTEITSVEHPPEPLPGGILDSGPRYYRGVLRYRDTLALLLDEDGLIP